MPKSHQYSQKFLDILNGKFTNNYGECDKLVIFQVDKIIEKNLDDGTCNYFCRGSLYTEDDLQSLGIATFKCNKSDYHRGDKEIVKIICKDEQGFFIVTKDIELDELLKFTYEYI